MAKEYSKRKIRVISNNLNAGLQIIQPVAYDFINHQKICITQTGTILRGRNFDGDAGEIPLNITLDRKRKLDGDRGYQMYIEFEVYDTEDPRWTDGVKSQNRKLLGLEKFLKTHPDVSYMSAGGEQLNPNCRQNLFEIEDEVELAKENFKKIEQSTTAKTLLTEIFKEDRKAFEEVVYGMGMGALLRDKDHTQIFNIMSTVIDMNPSQFLKFLESDDRELAIILHKASTPVGENGVSEIARDGQFYVVNGEIIAKSFDELKMYYRNNEKQFAYLKEKYGIKKKVAPSKTSKSAALESTSEE
jgi:predicted heme/steroid binding protein